MDGQNGFMHSSFCGQGSTVGRSLAEGEHVQNKVFARSVHVQSVRALDMDTVRFVLKGFFMEGVLFLRGGALRGPVLGSRGLL